MQPWKQSNNVFYEFSSVKSGTSGNFQLVDTSKMKSTIFKNRLVAQIDELWQP